MIQKSILIFAIVLNMPFLMHGMNVNKLGSIDTQLVKLYAKKIGTAKLLDQLKHCRPMEIIEPDPQDPRDIIHYKKFPCIQFATLVMHNITSAKDLYFWTGLIAEPHLNAAVLTRIEEIESKDGYIPENIVTKGKDFVSVRMSNNRVGRHTRYWRHVNHLQVPYVECDTTFCYEDKEVIEEALS